MEVTWLIETTTDGGEYDHQQQQQPYYELYTAARFITGLILYPIICLFGLTGNALIIAVLAHKVALSSTDVLLAALAISDAVKLINDVLYSATCATMQVNPSAGQSMFAYLYPYAHFVFNAAVCVSAWLVVTLAVERYLLVCWPTRTRNLTSAARSLTAPTSRSRRHLTLSGTVVKVANLGRKVISRSRRQRRLTLSGSDVKVADLGRKVTGNLTSAAR